MVLSGLWPILLFNAVLLSILLCKPLPHHIRVVTDNLAQCLGPLAAALWALHGARKSITQSSSRWASTFLGLGVLGFSIGQIIWTYYELGLHQTTPFPSWADAGFLSAYPFLFLGVLGLPTRPLPWPSRLRALFDGLMIMLALLTFSWYFVLGPTLMQGGETFLARAIGTAYPLADLVLLSSGLILAYRAGGTTLRPVAVPLTLGFISIIGIDSVFDYQTLHGTYVTGHPVDVGWPLGYMLVAVAARAMRSVKIADDLEMAFLPQTPLFSQITGASKLTRAISRMIRVCPSLIPYTVVPAVVGLVWHTVRTVGDEKLEPGVYTGACLWSSFFCCVSS